MSHTISKALAAPSSEETANYMADLTLELLKMAKSHHFNALQQIYEMAYYEAYSKAHPVHVPPEDLEEFTALVKEIRRERDIGR